MSDLRELYQSVILDHNRKPRNYGPLADAGGQAEGRNPLCGDNVTVWVKTEGGASPTLGSSARDVPFRERQPRS